MRTIDGEPKLIWSCEPAARYPFRVVRSIAGNQGVKRADEHAGGHPHISVTQGEMLVDNFSSVDHTIETA